MCERCDPCKAKEHGKENMCGCIWARKAISHSCEVIEHAWQVSIVSRLMQELVPEHVWRGRGYPRMGDIPHDRSNVRNSRQSGRVFTWAMVRHEQTFSCQHVRTPTGRCFCLYRHRCTTAHLKLHRCLRAHLELHRCLGAHLQPLHMPQTKHLNSGAWAKVRL